MNKQVITDMFLTKEAFEQHARKLREEKAKEYGLTLEQWDEAVRTGATISPITPHNNIIQPTPNNDNKPQ
jgi:hypothetical protein